MIRYYLSQTLCVCILLLTVVLLPASEYYIATTGNDKNAGSFAAPFASIMRAQQTAIPGDTIFIRGGTYRMNESQIAQCQRGRAQVITFHKSGEPNKLIHYVAYQNEHPIFDFSEVKPVGLRVYAFYVTASYIHLKNIAIIGVQVTITGHTQSVCVDNEGSHNIYDTLQMHDGQAIGFWLGRGSNNLVLNCDAYRNYDCTSETKRGGNVDGFGFHVPSGSVNNIFRGCRAWFNSDDGFDLINTREAVLIENCWAFYNGYEKGFIARGDGNGFKLGGYGVDSKSTLPNKIPRHVIRRSLAVRNRASGFYANHQPGGIDFIHNTAYLNGVNFNLLGRNKEHTADVPGYDHVMINNLGYKGRREVASLNMESGDVKKDYFSQSWKLRDDLFESLDDAELMKSRQANGELPEIPLMRLKAGNPAIDHGVDLHQPFHGKAPDFGAFESGK